MQEMCKNRQALKVEEQHMNLQNIDQWMYTSSQQEYKEKKTCMWGDRNVRYCNAPHQNVKDITSMKAERKGIEKK